MTPNPPSSPFNSILERGRKGIGIATLIFRYLSSTSAEQIFQTLPDLSPVSILLAMLFSLLHRRRRCDSPARLLGRRRRASCYSRSHFCARYLSSRSRCSAAFRYQNAACASSLLTTPPLAYMEPRLDCAAALPCSAAFRYQAAACASSFATPRPPSCARPR